VANDGRVAIRRGNALFFEAEPNFPKAGDVMTLTTRTGITGHFTLMIVDAVNGTPTWVALGVVPFDPSGGAQISGAVPPGLAGITIGLRSYTANAVNRLIASAQETLLFQ
jgi:hypothetical protein